MSVKVCRAASAAFAAAGAMPAMLRQALRQLAVLLVVGPLLRRADREAADDGTARAHRSGHPYARTSASANVRAHVVLAVGD